MSKRVAHSPRFPVLSGLLLTFSLFLPAFSRPACRVDQERAATLTVTPKRTGEVKVNADPGATGPEPIPGALFGLTVLNYDHARPDVPYGTARTWDAVGLDWSHLNPSHGIFLFGALDRFLAQSQSRSVDVIYTFGRTPQWASSRPDEVTPYGLGECAPPTDVADWEHFVEALVAHADGRIRYWELWNEPNNPAMWCPGGNLGAPQMVLLAQHAYRIIKSIDASAQVLSPAITGREGPIWLDWYMSEGGGAYTDIVAFHGYWSSNAEDIFQVIGKYQRIRHRWHLDGKPLWDTENSWASWDATTRSSPVSLLNQIAFIPKSYLLHWSSGVPRLVWYAWDGGTTWGGLSRREDGVSSAAAYEKTYRWLVGAVLTQPCMIRADKVWICHLSRSGGHMFDLIWSSRSQVQVVLPANLSTYEELSGRAHALHGRTVIATETPVLVDYADTTVRVAK